MIPIRLNPRLVGILAFVTGSSAVLTPLVFLDKRAVCNSDNCLRALKAEPLPASAFCSTYTTSSVTATTGIPTYIPTTCAPSRISSACSCFVTPTASPTACPTGQVIVNPDFYDCDANGSCGPTLAPWTITHLASTSGCDLITGCYSCAYDQDPSSV